MVRLILEDKKNNGGGLYKAEITRGRWGGFLARVQLRAASEAGGDDDNDYPQNDG